MVSSKLMRSVQFTEFGEPNVMKVKSVQIPTPSPNDILIRVKYAGVNKPDALQRAGLYNPPPGANPTLGLEVSGEVVKTGENVNRWKVGDLVTALVPGGGYAEYVITNQGHALRVPKGINLLEAAGICETFFTVWMNVFMKGNLKRGENFLVHGGSSGIGTTAIQLASEFGANVYTTAGSVKKCSACEDLGASLAINYKTEDFEKALKDQIGKGGINLILDMVGGPYIEKNLKLLSKEGRLVLIGFLGGHEATINFMRVMIKRLLITGSTLRAQSDQQKTLIASELNAMVWPLLESAKVKPIIDSTFLFEDVVAAHEKLETSTHIGKIILEVD